MLLLLLLTSLGLAHALSLPRAPSGLNISNADSLGLVGAPTGFETFVDYEGQRINNVTFAESIFYIATEFCRGDLNERIPAREFRSPEHLDFAVQVYPHQAATIKVDYVLWALVFSNADMLVRRRTTTEAVVTIKVNSQILGQIRFRKSSGQTALEGPETNSTTASEADSALTAGNRHFGYDFIVTDPLTWIGQPGIYAALVNAAALVAEENPFLPGQGYDLKLRAINMAVSIGPPDPPRRRMPYNTKDYTILSLRASQVFMKVYNRWVAIWTKTLYDNNWISSVIINNADEFSNTDENTIVPRSTYVVGHDGTSLASASSNSFAVT